MADTQALFQELRQLSPEDAGELGEMLKAKMPKSDKKNDTPQETTSEETPSTDAE
jgi:hypothetical protein